MTWLGETRLSQSGSTFWRVLFVRLNPLMLLRKEQLMHSARIQKGCSHPSEQWEYTHHLYHALLITGTNFLFETRSALVLLSAHAFKNISAYLIVVINLVSYWIDNNFIYSLIQLHKDEMLLIKYDLSTFQLLVILL